MSSYKPVKPGPFAKYSANVSDDVLYWRQFEFPITVSEFTSVNSVDISSQEPHYVAVSTGPKVEIYHCQTAQIWRTISRFRQVAYGCRFRQDGQLLASGSEESQVKLFNYRQNEMLRVFKGHKGPVRCVDFISGHPQLASFSDDKDAILWDITNESQICRLSEHKDFIRTGTTSPVSEHLILSGSYDHTVKLWDTRTGASVWTVDHGAPVESVLCYPSGGIFVSAGGCDVCVFDMIGGELLTRLTKHHKTVTCLRLASDNKRLLSGSLDRHLKVYDVDNYSVVHSMDFPASILCLAATPGDSTLVVGMISGGSGLLSFQHKMAVKSQLELQKTRKTRKENLISEDFKIMPNDDVVQHFTRQKTAKYDDNIRRFEYTRALQCVLKTATTKPDVAVTVMSELIRRGGLKQAIAGQTDEELEPLVNFLKKNIRVYRFKRILTDVTHTLIDIYGETPCESKRFLHQLQKLRDEVAAEIELTNGQVTLSGAAELFLAICHPPQVSSSETIFSTPMSNIKKATPATLDSLTCNFDLQSSDDSDVISLC